jgi:UMF1 family MFS transporter
MTERVVSEPAPNKPAPRSALAGWVLFDWAAQPFFTLVLTFVYAPYFATAVASSPERGQALWGFATAAAGFTIALCSPVLGAIADASGQRKPWIAAFGAVLVIASASLWFGRPGDAGSIMIVLMAFAIATVAVEFATVFNNAMMPGLVPPDKLGRLSGAGWATGYVGGLVSLIITLGLLAGNPETGKTLLGLDPLFGLGPAQREGDRAAGPLSSIWFVVFVLPLFLFTPDTPKKRPVREAVRQGLATLRLTLRELPRHRNVALFLLANMIYADGLVALFAFGGIFAASTFGWITIEIGLFGILLTITGTAGALIGGALDDRIGSKPVILGALTLLLLSLFAILCIGRDYVGPFTVTPPMPGDGLYASAGEKAYLAIGAAIGFAAGPLQAASRTFLARIAPPDRITQFYGLFALTGRITSFLGPLLVASVTQLASSQRAGLSVITVFFLVGGLLLASVRAR